MEEVIGILPKEIEINYKDQTFYAIQPTANILNKGDLIHSKVFFDALDYGVKTEDEILELMERSKRFNQEKFVKDLAEAATKVSGLHKELSETKNEKELKDKFELVRFEREKMNEIVLSRQRLLQHSAEFKALTQKNTFLLGCCIKNSNEEFIFRVIDPITKDIDIDSTHEAVINYENSELIMTLMRKFMPFLNGIVNPRETEQEFEIYSKRRKELGLEDDEISKHITTLEKVLNEKEEQFKKEFEKEKIKKEEESKNNDEDQEKIKKVKTKKIGGETSVKDSGGVRRIVSKDKDDDDEELEIDFELKTKEKPNSPVIPKNKVVDDRMSDDDYSGLSDSVGHNDTVITSGAGRPSAPIRSSGSIDDN